MAIDESQFAGMTEAERVKAKAKLLLSMRYGRKSYCRRRKMARRSPCMLDHRAGEHALQNARKDGDSRLGLGVVNVVGGR